MLESATTHFSERHYKLDLAVELIFQEASYKEESNWPLISLPSKERNKVSYGDSEIVLRRQG
jgi:hypothetical protein